jgi:hypothetical protein
LIFVELLTILAILIGGSFLIRAVGIQAWILPALGFVMGIALMLILGTIQVVTSQPTTPLSTLFLTLLIPIGIWLWYYKKGETSFFRIVPTILFLIAVIAAIIGLHTANHLNLTPDSYRYAQVGSLFESGNMEFAQAALLLKRLIAVPLMHAPANLADHFFLASITPLLALVTAAILAWFCQKGLQTEQDSWWTVCLFPIAAALILATNQFFIYNAFYVNGHILYAVLLLLIAGSSWLYACDADVSKTALKLILFLAIPALIVTRPEGGLHVGLVLIPVFISSKFPLRLKALLSAVLGASILIWNGFLWMNFSAAGQNAPIAVTGMFCGGLFAFLFIPFLYSRFAHYMSPRLLSVTEIVLWTSLAIAALLEPKVFAVSIHATITNIFMGRGMWGFSLIMIGMLFIGVLIFSNAPSRIFLRFPVTTFIPLGLLLAHLRDFPYRASMFDSFNRMFLHILPLAILFIVSSAATRRWGFFITKPSSKIDKKRFEA